MAVSISSIFMIYFQYVYHLFLLKKKLKKESPHKLNVCTQILVSKCLCVILPGFPFFFSHFFNVHVRLGITITITTTNITRLLLPPELLQPSTSLLTIIIIINNNNNNNNNNDTDSAIQDFFQSPQCTTNYFHSDTCSHHQDAVIVIFLHHHLIKCFIPWQDFCIILVTLL